MKHPTKKAMQWWLLFSMLIAHGAMAQSGGPFEISRATINAGGDSSSGGVFEVTGTIGQYQANGTTDVAQYELTGGFWVAAGSTGNDLIFADDFE